MALLCLHCSAPADDDAPWCARCGSDLVPADRTIRPAHLPVLSRRHDVVINRQRVNCVAYDERLRHDPFSDVMSSVFSCSHYPERIDCVGCRICTTCGDLRCTCGLLAIHIGVKIKATVIETVALAPRLS